MPTVTATLTLADRNDGDAPKSASRVRRPRLQQLAVCHTMRPTARSADGRDVKRSHHGAADHHPPDHAPCTRCGDGRRHLRPRRCWRHRVHGRASRRARPVAPTRPISCERHAPLASSRRSARNSSRTARVALRGPTAGRGMGAPSRSARAGSRVRSELTTPHQHHQLGFGGSGGTTGRGPNEYDDAVVLLNEPPAGITAARGISAGVGRTRVA